MKISYKIKDLLIIHDNSLHESPFTFISEVTDVCQEAKAIKLDNVWFSIDKISSKILGKYGRVEYKPRFYGLLGKKRIIIKE